MYERKEKNQMTLDILIRTLDMRMYRTFRYIQTFCHLLVLQPLHDT